MKKVLLAIPTLGKGGAEDIVVNLANSLVDTYDVRLLVLKRVDEDEYNYSRLSKYIHIDSLNEQGEYLNSLKMIIRSMSYYYRRKVWAYDIVHCNLTMASLVTSFWQVLSFLRKRRPKFIETFHTNFHLLPLSRVVIFVLGWNLRDYLVYEIHEEEKVKIEKFLLNKTKLKYIPFSASPHRDEVKVDDSKMYSNFDSNKINLLTVSRIRLFEKKIGFMIEVIKSLRNEFGHNCHLTLAGDGKDTEEVEVIIKTNNLQEHVTLTGYVDNPERYMKHADFYMCATVGEDPGISGIQAVQMYLPLIGVQTVEGYIASHLKSFENPKDAAKFISFLINNPDETEQYVKRTQIYISGKFDHARMVESYKKLYD